MTHCGGKRGSKERVGGLVVTFVLAGCTPWAELPAGVMGPIEDTPSREAFERVVAAAHTAGYDTASENPEAGTFEVPSWIGRPNRQYTIRVRVYQEGWIQLVPEGPGVKRLGDEYTMPHPVREDLKALYFGMEAALEAGR